MAIRSILRQFDLFCANLVDFMVIWPIYSRVGVLYREKSSNPGLELDPILRELQRHD
jgi:hypothetical protein